MNRSDWTLADVALIGVVIVIVFFILRRTNRRHTALKEWAKQRGWSFTLRNDSLLDGLRDYPRPGSGTVQSVLEGKWSGQPALSFTHSTTGIGEKGGARSMHMVGIGLRGSLPKLELRADSATSPEREGWTTIETGSEKCDNTWSVSTQDPDFARDMLSPAVVGLLERDDFARCQIWIGGTHIWAGFAGITKQEQIEPTLNHLQELTRLIPPHLMTEKQHWQPEDDPDA